LGEDKLNENREQNSSNLMQNPTSCIATGNKGTNKLEKRYRKKKEMDMPQITCFVCGKQ
jgi:hypothetical protein